MKRCLVLFAALTLLLSQASAVVISYQLGTNPDGFRDTAKQCLDGITSCRPPGPSILACDDSAAPSLSGIQTGNAYSADVRQYFSGSAAATATLSVVSVAGSPTDATTQWSISSSGAGNNLVNAGSVIGSGGLVIRGTTSGNILDCPTSRNWSYVAPPTTDVTPPTLVTGLHSDSVGSGTITLSANGVMDPNDSVARTGVASYKFYRNGVFVDSLAAPTPGLVCDFTAIALGSISGSPSGTQGTGANGAQWTIVGGGYGVETSTPDNYYGVFCPVAGTEVHHIDRVDSISNALTYNKVHADLRNSSSTTDVHFDCVLLRQANTYYMQRTMRTVSGATNASTTAVALPGSPPYYRKVDLVSGTATCSYSTDGVSFTPVVSNAISFTDAKIMGVGVSATSTGSNSAAVTAVLGTVAVQTNGRITKTLMGVASGTATFTATATDIQGNENSPLAGVTDTVGSPSAFKWHPGHYVQQRGGAYVNGTGSNAARHAGYAAYLNNTNVTGVNIWVLWQYLENETGGDYSAGITFLTNEIAYIKANYPGKYIMVTFFVSYFGAGVSLTTEKAAYPDYFVNAGCVAEEGTTSFVPKISDPTCRNYEKALLAAYGAAFDSEPYLEALRIDQETNYGYYTPTGQGWDGPTIDTAWKDLALAARNAFPTTNILIPLNGPEVYTAAQQEALDIYYKSIHVAIGEPDTCPYDTGTPFCAAIPSLAPAVVYRGLGGSTTTGHDYCGEMANIPSVETSELGYNAQPPHPNGLTSLEVVTAWNNDYCATHGIWDYNVETGSTDTQRWNGAHGELWAINNNPITHTTKPAGYP